MTGIAGIAHSGNANLVEKMINKMSHRGWAWHDIIEGKTTTIGLNGIRIQENALDLLKHGGLARDGSCESRFAQAQATTSGIILK